MRLLRLVACLGMLLAGAVCADGPEPKDPRRLQLILELTLPRPGLPPLGKGTAFTPDLKGTALNPYIDKGDPKSPLCHAVRSAQVALWVCSPEAVPPPLQKEVQAARKKLDIDPNLVRLRFPIPANNKAEAKLKEEVLATSRRMSRQVAHLEETLEKLKDLEGDRSKQGRRWEAHYDLVRLWLLLRLIGLEEHQLALGNLRKELPEHDPGKHRAWQLVPESKLLDSTSRKYLKEAKKLADRMADQHRDTAWSKLARQVIDANLSARWEAVP